MTNAREIVAMRTLILDGLKPSEIRAVNFQAVADAAAPAMERGWTGQQIARAALANLDGAKSLGAVMVANVRQLGTQDPPRTPTPPPARAVLTGRQTPAADPAAWAAMVREAIREAHSRPESHGTAELAPDDTPAISEAHSADTAKVMYRAPGDTEWTELGPLNGIQLPPADEPPATPAPWSFTLPFPEGFRPETQAWADFVAEADQ